MQITITRDYASARREAYPPLEQLADALYHQQRGNDVPMQQYLSACAAVKVRFPKPQTDGENA